MAVQLAKVRFKAYVVTTAGPANQTFIKEVCHGSIIIFVLDSRCSCQKACFVCREAAGTGCICYPLVNLLVPARLNQSWARYSQIELFSASRGPGIGSND